MATFRLCKDGWVPPPRISDRGLALAGRRPASWKPRERQGCWPFQNPPASKEIRGANPTVRARIGHPTHPPVLKCPALIPAGQRQRPGTSRRPPRRRQRPARKTAPGDASQTAARTARGPCVAASFVVPPASERKQPQDRSQHRRHHPVGKARSSCYRSQHDQERPGERRIWPADRAPGLHLVPGPPAAAAWQ